MTKIWIWHTLVCKPEHNLLLAGLLGISVYLHQAGGHVACGLPRLVVDVGHHLDDLAWCVTLHVDLALQHHCARFHQHVGELLRDCR